MYASVLPLAVSFALLFRPPAGLGEVGLFVWLLVFTVLVRLSVTTFQVPHMALGAELSTDYRERTSIVAYRNFLAYIGAAAVIGLGWSEFFRATPEFPNGQLNHDAYPPFGVFFGVAAALTVLVSALGTHGRIPFLPVPHEAPKPLSLGRLTAELRDTLSNPSFRVLFVGVVLFFVTRGVAHGLDVYMFTHFWRLTPEAILRVQGIGLIGVLLGTVAWVMLAGRIDKKPAFLVGITTYSIFTLLPPLARLWDWFPHHDASTYVPLLGALAFIAALGAAASLVTSGSMMADIADEHELNTGHRQEGIFFGGLTFAAKATSGLGQFVAGFGLDIIEFPVRATPGTVPSETITALAILYGPGIAVIAAVAIVILSRYRIDRARHEEIVRALLARRQERSPAAAHGGG
jgi:Na+/melibiose symporter-like transporter